MNGFGIFGMTVLVSFRIIGIGIIGFGMAVLVFSGINLVSFGMNIFIFLLLSSILKMSRLIIFMNFSDNLIIKIQLAFSYPFICEGAKDIKHFSVCRKS